jgi:hypothetical protein
MGPTCRKLLATSVSAGMDFLLAEGEDPWLKEEATKIIIWRILQMLTVISLSIGSSVWLRWSCTVLESVVATRMATHT